MSDNSGNRKKALIISVLAFLFAGGGIFLFFIVQGSNELTGKGKNNSFSYGTAAREGVSSFFKSMGVFPDEEARLAERVSKVEFVKEDRAAAAAGLSDWMASAPSPASPVSAGASYGRPSTPTSVPRMSAQSVGQQAGSGGSKSAGSVTRFGGESATGLTSVSNIGKAGLSGTTDKGTMGSLKNARALLGEGLKSNSAMTAQGKWGQSFGAGGSGGKSGDLAYNKTGLVNLDKIKSGEISDLKTTPSRPSLSPDASGPALDKAGTDKALAADKNVKKAEDKLKSDIAKEAVQQAADAALSDKDNKGGGDTKGEKPPEVVMDAAKNMALFERTDMGGGESYKESGVDVSKNEDGSYNAVYRGQYTDASGTRPMPITAKIGADGSFLGWAD